MPTRDEVLAEFTRGRVTKWHSTHDMADEIVRLRERLAVTDAQVEAFLAAYAKCESEHGLAFTHRMGITEALKSSLTAASEVQP